MIKLNRPIEPEFLVAVRKQRLSDLRALGREPSSKEILGYNCVAKDLWRGQDYKCCYCEMKVPCGYNDVEHYRPKAKADRLPGAVDVHGYWWLAYSWSNLLFACPACNRSGKNSKFPLDPVGGVLCAEVEPPGSEIPLLIDPASGDPSLEIEYAYCSSIKSRRPGWYAVGRSGSLIGGITSDVCDLNRDELLELRADHVEKYVRPQVDELFAALSSSQGLAREIRRAFRVFESSAPYACLSYDAMTALLFLNDFPFERAPAWPGPGDFYRAA